MNNSIRTGLNEKFKNLGDGHFDHTRYERRIKLEIIQRNSDVECNSNLRMYSMTN